MCSANGDDPTVLARTCVDTINAALVGEPDDLRVTIRACRVNFKRAWVARGCYAPVVAATFSTCVDGDFMEFDSERAGGFGPLHALQDSGDRKVVLGPVTAKFGALEAKRALKRRIDEAAKALPLERLCLSPQCGFSSTHHVNALSADDQWRKLERAVELAHKVWG